MSDFFEFVIFLRKSLQLKVIKAINFIFTFLFYFIGIGLTSLVAKIFRKRFTESHFTQSSWKVARPKLELFKQY
ncbi:MAG: hypothetical protein M3Q81_02405 [bacterium]|nr:hypothetical protein [bacterium]